MSDRVLLTVTSGAFLSVSAMTDSSTKALFLIPDHKVDTRVAERLNTIERTVDKLHLCVQAQNVEVVQLSDFKKRLTASECEKPDICVSESGEA